MHARVGRRRQDDRPVQAEAGRTGDDHPHHRLQRRDRRVPEPVYHRLGCRWPGSHQVRLGRHMYLISTRTFQLAVESQELCIPSTTLILFLGLCGATTSTTMTASFLCSIQPTKSGK